MLVVLDAGPLGMVTNSKVSFEVEQCKNWLTRLSSSGNARIVIPKIADYEVRRS